MFVLEDLVAEKKQREEQFLLMEKIIQEEKEAKVQDIPLEEDEEKQQKVGKKQKIAKVTKAKKTEEKPKAKKQTEEKVPLHTNVSKTKKTQIDKALQNFIPRGINLSLLQPPTQEEYNELLEVIDVKQFTLNYKTYIGKVLKVTDGDTVKVAIRLQGVLTRFSFRLDGVDTPESRSGQVKQFGQYVKQVLRRMLEGKIVKVEAGQFDKYGRPLSRIYAFSKNEEFCVNDFLIENDLAKPYTGKTKDQFTKKDYEIFTKKYNRAQWPQVQHYPREQLKK